jgi:hypothetical protein
MGRSILALGIGIVVSFLASALGGYLLYRMSGQIGPQAPALARYVLNPIIAIIVGAMMGGLLEARAGILTAIALVPWALGFLLFRKQDISHLTLLAVLGLVYLSIGAATATITSNRRN